MFLILIGMVAASDPRLDGRAAGEADARADVSAGGPLGVGAALGATGGLACCVAGPFGIPVAVGVGVAAPVLYASTGRPPDVELSAADAEYIEGYREGYAATARRRRVRFSLLGAAGGAVVVGGAGIGAGLLYGALVL